MCNKFFFNYIRNIINYEGQIISKTFLCKVMLCSEGRPYTVHFLFGYRVYVRYHWGLVSSFVNRRASYRANIYSKIFNCCNLNMSSTFRKPSFL